MTDLALLTPSLEAGRDLADADVAGIAAALAAEGPADDVKAAFLSALSRKGESASEVAAFARAFRALSRDPGVSDWSARAVDIVGTGGDHAGGFNVSSLVTLVVASAGVPVMKHGNRGITSKCGSADLFAAFGVDLDPSPARIRAALGALGYAFFFAPSWQPAFRRIGPVRKLLASRGERSVFNILGPLLNPGRPANILLGRPPQRWPGSWRGRSRPSAPRPAWPCTGRSAMGPGSTSSRRQPSTMSRGSAACDRSGASGRPESLGLARSPFSEIQGDVAQNLALASALADGAEPRPVGHGVPQQRGGTLGRRGPP